MLIQGSPDILSPPTGPLSGLGAVPSPDARLGTFWRDQFIATRGQAAYDEVQRILASGQSDAEILSRLYALGISDVWRAVGISLEAFNVWAGNVQIADQLAKWWSAELDVRDKARTILDYFLASSLTDADTVQATGLTREGLRAWAQGSLTRDEGLMAQSLRAVFSLSMTPDELAQVLTQFASREGLTASDMARLSGRSLEEIRAILARAAGVVTWRGAGIVLQASASRPGYVFSQCGGESVWTWHYIPPGSSRVARVEGCAMGGGVGLTTEDGVYLVILPGSDGVRQLPIRDDTWGRLTRITRDPSLDYMTKNRELLKAVEAMGVTNPREIDEWVIEGAAKVRAWDAVQQGDTPDFQEVGVQAVNFSQDAELNAEFAAIDSDPNLSDVEKAQAFTEIAARENLSIADVSRIVGVQDTIVREFMEQGGYGTDTYGQPEAVVVAVPEPITVSIPGAVPQLQAGSIPANLPEMSAIEKAQAYNTLLDLGNTDALIREVIEYQFGKQADADWAALQALAASLRIPPTMDTFLTEPSELFPTPTPVRPPTMPVFYTPEDVREAQTPLQKAEAYNQLRAKGMSDQAIRAEVERVYGAQRDEDWAALQALAESQRRGAVVDEMPLLSPPSPAAGGGLGPIILAVAAAALLGG